MITSSRAFRKLIVLLTVTSIALVAAPTASAGSVSAPVTRNGEVVGRATAYVAAANGYAVLDPMLRSFEPPVTGQRYSVYTRLRFGCAGSVYNVTGMPRTATFNGTASFWTHGVIKECSGRTGSIEAWLYVKRVSTGAIVGRARLFSAG